MVVKMNISEIQLGGLYLANVEGSKKRVRVIREAGYGRVKSGYVVDCEGEKVVIQPADFLLPFGRKVPMAPKPVEVREDRPAPPRPVRKAEAPVAAKARPAVNPGKPSLSAMLASAKANGAKQGKGLAAHLVVEARAGTGKTFTLVEGLKRIKGQPTPGVKGSPQQEAVWAAMVKGAKPESVTFCAFNRSIADELARRVPRGCQASTLHGLGFAVCMKAYKINRDNVNDYKTDNLLEALVGVDSRQLRKVRPLFVSGVREMVKLCKMTLTEPTREGLEGLAEHYAIELGSEREEVLDTVPEIIERSRTLTHEVDYADMIWLPVVNRLPVQRVDLLLVDEAQDLNRCQQSLAMKFGRRLILCGDARQAIYGFAGADTDSLPRMKALLNETDLGCQALPLTVTRRCGAAIVAEAQALVPDFEGMPENGKGKVTHWATEEMRRTLADGDMVLCRLNAPLVSLVFQLIRQKRKATIQGRNIGESLELFIRSLKADTVEMLLVALDDYHAKEAQRLAERKNPSEAALIALQDRVECVRAFCDGAASLEEVCQRIREIFQDGKQEGILLSSIHRAKGLEAKRVWIIAPEKLPHPMARTEWQREQELNLKYVAITRAVEELAWVDQG